MLQEFYRNHIHRYIYPMSLTSAGSSGYYAQVFGSMSNLSLLTIGDYYNYSHDKIMKEKQRPGRDMVWVMVGVASCVPWPRGLAWLHYFPYPCRLRTVHCWGWQSGHRLIILSTYLFMGVGRLVTLLSWVPALSGPTDWRRGKVEVLGPVRLAKFWLKLAENTVLTELL